MSVIVMKILPLNLSDVHAARSSQEIRHEGHIGVTFPDTLFRQLGVRRVPSALMNALKDSTTSTHALRTTLMLADDAMT